MFKLIPIKDFEKSDLNKDPKCDKRKGDDDDDGGDDDDEDGGGGGGGGAGARKKRSIKDIIDSSSLENTEFEPSKHYVAEQKFLQKGSGTTPIWLPNERGLPQFSRGSRIKKSHDDLSRILNDNSISDDLKVRLYTMFRKKYTNAVNARESDGDDDDDYLVDDGDYITKGKKRERERVEVVRDIVEKMAPGLKRENAQRIINVLARNKKHLGWDYKGTIQRPPHRNLELVENMENLLKIMLHRNRGTALEVDVVADLVKPFFRDVEEFIMNDKLIREIKRKLVVDRRDLPQYVSWYKMWNK